MEKHYQNLVEAHLAGTLTSREKRELHLFLAESEENREAFCAQAMIHGRLQWEMRDVLGLHSPETGKTARMKVCLAIAAVLLLGLFSVALFRHLTVDSRESSAELVQEVAKPPVSPVRTVARLTSASRDSLWKGSARESQLLPGQWFKPGTYQLAAGTATITLDSGAQITLSAPSSLELLGSNEARLHHGTVSVDVPKPALGFTLETPSGRVVDLSTQFGVTVADDLNDEVQVIEGEVIVQYGDGNAQSQLLREHSAVHLHASGDSKGLLPATYNPDAYPRKIPYRAHKTSLNAGYVHWGFNDIDPATAFLSDGTLKGAGRCPANIAGKTKHKQALTTKGVFGKALHLDGDGTWLKTRFPGIAGSKSRTVAFWVRIPPHVLDRQAYSIIGWGHPAPGATSQKWEIGWNTGKWPQRGTGTKGAIRTDFGLGHTIGSTDLRDGRWHHIASVFTGGEDADIATHVRHYVDGHLEGFSAYKQQAVNTQIDKRRSIAAVIGKYLQPGSSEFSFFQGSIDELYVFNAALTPEQILQLMETNKPPTSDKILPLPKH